MTNPYGTANDNMTDMAAMQQQIDVIEDATKLMVACLRRIAQGQSRGYFPARDARDTLIAISSLAKGETV